MKKLILVLVLALASKVSFGYENHWTPDDSQFALYMNVLCVVNIDGVEQERTELEIGAFCGEQCRGSKFAEQFPVTGKYIFRLAVYGNSGDNITFRLYDHELQTELELESQDVLVWEMDGYGTLGSPYVLHFTGGTPTSFTFLGSETDHNWSTPSNWLENMVPQSSSEVIIDGICILDKDAKAATITVNKGKALTIGEDYVLSYGGITLKDGAQFIDLSGGEYTVTMEKEIAAYSGTRDNYYFIANPTDADFLETDGLLTGSYDLYFFDQSGLDDPDEGELPREWQNYKDWANHTNWGDFEADYNAYLYANNANTTLSFTGVVSPDDGGTTIKKLPFDNSVDYAGFNLVGNPYPFNASASRGTNTSGFFAMNETGNEVITVEDPVVAPCAALFVVSTRNNNNNASVTFERYDESAKVGSACSMLNVELYDERGMLSDRAYVKFGEGENLQKFTLNADAPHIFFREGGRDYANFNANGANQLPLYFITRNYGTYTISVSLENLTCGHLHLIDNLIGRDIDLLTTPSYTFTASTGDYAARFRLEFENTGIEENNEVSETFAIVEGRRIVIPNIEHECILEVIDMTGRTVCSEKVSGSYDKSLNLKAGVYVVKLNGMTQKIVVK